MCTTKRSIIEGHAKTLHIARNPEWILGLISFYLGVILTKRSAVRADTPTYQKGSPPNKTTSTLKSTPDFLAICNTYLCLSIVLLFIVHSCLIYKTALGYFVVVWHVPDDVILKVMRSLSGSLAVFRTEV